MRSTQTQTSIHSLCNQANRLDINTRPQYQRESIGVWNDRKRQLLIDSILRGYDLPKFFMRRMPTPGHPDAKEVIDGQQRIRAIWDFQKNKFALGKVSRTLGDLAMGGLEGKFHDDLIADDQTKFADFQITISYLEESSEYEVRDMFLRLQEGSALNPAEKRNALPGNLRDFISIIASGATADQVFKLTHIRDKRYAWQDLAAHCVAIELRDGPTDLKAADLYEMTSKEQNFELSGQTANNLKKNFNIMSKILKMRPPEMDIKWGFVDLYLLVRNLRKLYVVKGKEGELHDLFVDFEARRRSSSGNQLGALAASTDIGGRDLFNYIEAFKTEGGTKKNLKIRMDVYEQYALSRIEFVPIDNKRNFLPSERIAIWRRAGMKCEQSGCGVTLKIEEMHADHIRPHSNGGATEIKNAQCLCSSHNLKKGARP